MSLTKRWSEADCLSRIMLSHAPRQATVSLTLSVRQKNMNIRILQQKDLAELVHLYGFLHPDDPVLDPESSAVAGLWSSILSNPAYLYLGVFIDDRLASTCTITVISNLTRGLRPYALIENMVTHPDYRKKGFGTAVLREALRLSWAKGCYKVMLETSRQAPETLRFYENVGFKRGLKTAFTAYPEE